MRLIDADALLEHVWDADTRAGYVQVVDRQDIENAPTIEERKNGKWIWQWDRHDYDTANEAVCSECGKASDMPVGYFCKWCGADMRGET